MKLPLMMFGFVAAAALAACSGGSSGGSAGNSAPPAGPNPPAAPMAVELAAFARAEMVASEDAMPRTLNDVELTSNEDNPSEFDDWFQ